jgi:hypothetical protein
MTPSRAAVLLSKLNGVLFPGGGADLSEGSQFIAAASLAFNTSVAAAAIGETFPIWGTCLVSSRARCREIKQKQKKTKPNQAAAFIHPQGFQTVCTVASRNFSLLQETDAENISLPLTWSADPTASRLLLKPSEILGIGARIYVSPSQPPSPPPPPPPSQCSGCSEDCRLKACQRSAITVSVSARGSSPMSAACILSDSTLNAFTAVTMNNHHFGVTPASFASDYRLSSMFNILSTNVDR